MQRAPAVRRERLLDRDARDLVAERDGVALGAQHARRQARVEPRRGRRPASASSSHSSAPRRDDRDGVEQRARARRPGARRGPAPRRARSRGSASPAAASTSVTKNGLPPVRACSSRVVDARRPGQRGDRAAARAAASAIRSVACRAAARRARSAADGRGRARRRGRWRRTSAGSRSMPAGEQAKDVQRGLVGPVQVLEHEDARRPPARSSRRQRCDEHARAWRPLGDDRRRARRRPPRRCRRAARAAAACTARRTRPTAPAPAAAPRRTRAASVVLPIPASPPMSTSRPRPCARTAPRCSVERGELRGALEQPVDAGRVGRAHRHIVAHRRRPWGCPHSRSHTARVYFPTHCPGHRRRGLGGGRAGCRRGFVDRAGVEGVVEGHALIAGRSALLADCAMRLPPALHAVRRAVMASLAMVFSSISVVADALRLRRFAAQRVQPTRLPPAKRAA